MKTRFLLLLFSLFFVLFGCEKNIPDDSDDNERTDTIVRIDTIYIIDSNHTVDTVYSINTIYSVDTIYIINTIYIIDTITGNNLHTYTIKGKVQKGPFRTGSTITVSELDSKLVPTGDNFYSTVSDNNGTFEVPNVKLESDIVEIMADGIFYHETFDFITNSRLVLKAVSNLNDQSTVNVNVLTHLTYDRIKYLMHYNGKIFSDAKLQSQNELLRVFNLDEEDQVNCDNIDISKSGELNSKLFAISMIVQGWKDVSPLSEFLTSFALDFKTDGTIDNKENQQHLVTSALFCNVGGIRKNTLKLYKITEFDDFQKYVNLFIEKTIFEPFVKFSFEKQTEFGENLLALPDNSTLSTSATYCISQNLDLHGRNKDFCITILEEEGAGNVTYTENDLTFWDYEKNYGSYEEELGIIIYGKSLRPQLLNEYSDTPLLLNFNGTGRIRLTIYFQDNERLPDNGGFHVVVKYFNW